MSKFHLSVATLIGSIIGAGILGLPFVIAQVGIKTGTIMLLVMGVLLMILNLQLGEVALRTKEKHQVTGLANIYLGKFGKEVMTVAMLIGTTGSLVAYTIGEGLSFASLFGGQPYIYSSLFLIFTAFILIKGLKTLGMFELIMSLILGAIVLIVSIIAMPAVKISNFQAPTASPLMAYGVILFSLYGITTIPVIKEMITPKKRLKQAIIAGSLTPLALYILFTTITIGAVGLSGFMALDVEQRIASAALQSTINGAAGILINIFAIAAMGTSFLAIATTIKETYMEDYNLSEKTSWALTMFLPASLYLLNAVYHKTNFIQLIGYVGALSYGLIAILIVIMFIRAKKLGKRKPEYQIPSHPLLNTLLIAVFVVGIIITLF